MINTGRSAVDREGQAFLASEIRDLLSNSFKGQRLAVYELRQQINEQSQQEVTLAQVQEALTEISNENLSITFNRSTGSINVA